jgi:hypothetical protein
VLAKDELVGVPCGEALVVENSDSWLSSSEILYTFGTLRTADVLVTPIARETVRGKV